MGNLNTYFTSGSERLTINADPDKYIYTDYGIGFDSRSEFSLPDGSMGKYVFIFCVDMSSYVGKDILISGEGLTQELDDTT